MEQFLQLTGPTVQHLLSLDDMTVCENVFVWFGW